MKRSDTRILTTHVGSLIRPPALQEFLRAKQAGKPYDEQAYEKCLTESVATVVRQQAQAGIDVVSDGEFGKSISWSQYALERLSGFERRPIKHEAANPFKRGADRDAFPGILRRARRPRRRRHHGRCDLRRADQIHRAGRVAARHRQLQGGAQGRESRRSVPAGGGAGERDPRPQERILQERRGIAGRDRRSDAHRIQDDHRRRLPGAARRRAQRRHL